MKENNMLKNWLYTIKALHASDKTAIYQMMINSVLSGMTPLIWVLAPKMIIDELMGEQNIMTIGMILVSAFVLAAIGNFFKAYFEESFRMKVSKMRLSLGLLVHDAGMDMDYRHTESEDDMVLMHQGIGATTSPTRGFGMILKVTYALGALFISFIGFSTIISTLHPLILLVVIINVIVVHYMMERAMKYSRDMRHEQKRYENRSRYIASVMSDFAYGKDIRIFQLKGLLNQKKSKNDYQRHLFNKHLEKKYLERDMVDVLFSIIRNIIVYGYVTYMVVMGQIGVGSFLMYIVSVTELTQVLKDMFYQWALMKTASVSVDDFQEFLERSKSSKEKGREVTAHDRELSLELKNVSFSYPGSDQRIFNNLNLKIEAGEKLAVVGVNGAGKTTLVKLLTKLYEPDEGEIFVNGQPYSDVKRDEIYALFSAVFQEIKPLAMSVAENIAIEDLEIHDDEIWKCLESAGLKDKISSLKHGLDTSLLKVIDREGIEMSGGENQKLALARALYKDGRVVILDEPTAALDPLAEKNIYESFNQMVNDRTAIFISHRLSSTKFCDRIVLFENGEIIESGSHEELMMLNGKYREMFDIQSQYYQEASMKEVG